MLAAWQTSHGRGPARPCKLERHENEFKNKQGTSESIMSMIQNLPTVVLGDLLEKTHRGEPPLRKLLNGLTE